MNGNTSNIKNEEDQEIDLMEILFVIIRRWKLIILIAIPIILSGVLFLKTRPEIYLSETTLIIQNNVTSYSIDSSEVSLNQKLVETYSEVGKSKTILENLIEKFDLDSNIEKIGQQISIVPVGDTELIKVSYTNLDPSIAAAVVNEFAREFMQKIQEVMNIRNIKVVEIGKISQAPIGQNTLIHLVLICIGGVGVGVVAAFLVEMLHKKLRKPEEMKEILETAMLTQIPKDVNGDIKKREVYFSENRNPEIEEAVRILRTNLEFLVTKKKNNKIMVTSSTPAEGKTFVSTNYSASIAMTGQKVLLIDTDIRRARVNKSFHKDIEVGLEAVLQGKVGVEEVILKDITKNLDILPSKYIEGDISELFSEIRLEKLFDELEKLEYDYIIVDTPPAMVATEGFKLSKYVDGVVIVVEYDQVSAKELGYTKMMYTNAKANLLGFVVNKISRSVMTQGNYGYYNNHYSYHKDYYAEEKKEETLKKKNIIDKVKDEYTKHLSGDNKEKRN